MPKKRKSKSRINAVLLAVLIECLSSTAYLRVAILTQEFVNGVRRYAGASCDGGGSIIRVVGGGGVTVVVVVSNWLLTR